MTHPGVGPLTALALVLIIGRAERFQCGKQIASYLADWLRMRQGKGVGPGPTQPKSLK
jgi:transposase